MHSAFQHTFRVWSAAALHGLRIVRRSQRGTISKRCLLAEHLDCLLLTMEFLGPRGRRRCGQHGIHHCRQLRTEHDFHGRRTNFIRRSDTKNLQIRSSGDTGQHCLQRTGTSRPGDSSQLHIGVIDEHDQCDNCDGSHLSACEHVSGGDFSGGDFYGGCETFGLDKAWLVLHPLMYLDAIAAAPKPAHTVHKLCAKKTRPSDDNLSTRDPSPLS